MCNPTLEVQYVNPTTQVALRSECVGECRPLLSIQWTIYVGYNDTNTGSLKWNRSTSAFDSFGRKDICFSSNEN